MSSNLSLIPALHAALSEVFTSGGVSYTLAETTSITTRTLRLPGRVTVIIGLIGSLRGRLIFSFDEESWKALTEAMIGDEAPDSLRISMLNELTNMLAGSMIRHNTLSDDLDITPPTLLVGSDMLLTGLEPPVLMQLVTLGTGTMRVVIAASA